MLTPLEQSEVRTAPTEVGTSPDSHAATGASHEAIERRAFELYLTRGSGDGDALSDWLQAEREIRATQDQPGAAA